MLANEYHFVSTWRVEGTLTEVADLLEDARELVRWWPSVYLEVSELEPGSEHGLGRLIALRAKGWLPYTLRLKFRTVETNYPHGFILEASGDLEGTGVWKFESEGSMVKVVYDWRVRANKSLVRKLSFLLKPVFESNHRWTMARGEESLKIELARRHAQSPEEAARIPHLRGPIWPYSRAR
jgi:hypothetical protein